MNFNSDEDIGKTQPFQFGGYHDLMRHHIQNILLVSSPYDAFILEEDGGLNERIFGAYQELELSSSPRINRVSSVSEALTELGRNRYDLVITMTHLMDLDPVVFGRKAKVLQPNVPVVLLATNTDDLLKYHKAGVYEGLDKVFLWTGDSALFLAIIKYFEDRANVEHDTVNGQVRIILVVENSSRYFSVFLPLILTEVMVQTQGLVAKSLNKHERFLKRRARPKILLAETFEEAMEIYTKYKDYLMGVITDVTYPREGKNDPLAGFRLVDSMDSDIPAIIQSSQCKHRQRAEDLGIPFLDKNSDTLLGDLRRFMKRRLGFGDFTFRKPNGKKIARASSIKEMEEVLATIPPESLRYHGGSNHFSNWLMARGEFELAAAIKPRKVSDFDDDEEIRGYLIRVFRDWRRKKHLGIITDFSKQDFELAETFTRYGTGSLGGKGRGIAFLASLLSRSELMAKFPKHYITLPETLVIATGEFDRFMLDNEMDEKLKSGMSNATVQRIFMKGKLPKGLKHALKKYLKKIDTPLAVRSSSLLEDSYNHPFAGIYSTYLIPNNHANIDIRVDQLCSAIKMVYASVFSKSAKAYMRTTSHKVEEEKMATVIQRVVGKRYGDRFYPVFAGMAQSRNFYPLPPMKPEDGVASVALGLGKIVMDGGKVLSFSPRRPAAIPGFSTTDEILKNSQKEFCYIDMKNDSFDLLKGEDATLATLPITEAEGDGTLDNIASVYDFQNFRLMPSLMYNGKRVLTFDGILKYDTYPLAKVLCEILNIAERGVGSPVEMEFAATPDENGELRFYILQVRPFLSRREIHKTEVNAETDAPDAFVFSTRSLGNGRIDDVRDIVFIPPELFDSAKTVEMAEEIDYLNKELKDSPYILMGPGRWGSRDRWLGIPVDWGNISNARVMVEAGFKDFQIDPSHGSHFFYNITTFGIPYFSVPYKSPDSFVDWEWLGGHKTSKLSDGLNYVKHVHLQKPITIKADGRHGRGVIMKKTMPQA